MSISLPTVGELVSVAEVETVVRLDGPGGLLAELVLTGDVAAALEDVLAISAGPGGAGFFVVGPFGSGKSHFLSAVAELAGGTAEIPSGWAPALGAAARAARRSLPVRVPLVDYRAEAALEDVVWARAWRALGWEARSGRTDRAESWDGVLAAAGSAGHEGLVLLLDEASEWLRAKLGPALTEDLRFLQFLGEWSQDRPVVVLVALQESIEEVANVSERELARIRDRYRGLHLSMRHVEDLVRGRLVRLQPGAERWVGEVGKELAASFPGAPVDPGRLARCYPLHPGALDVLEGLKFVLSQNRGVVDFVYRQVRADLARPAGSLVTPDRIYDHFSDRFHERRESARLADAVVPYYERAAEEIFEARGRFPGLPARLGHRARHRRPVACFSGAGGRGLGRRHAGRRRQPRRRRARPRPPRAPPRMALGNRAGPHPNGGGNGGPRARATCPPRFCRRPLRWRPGDGGWRRGGWR
ncbi:MAG: DUF6079 family protein [Acidimicrobiales bacterium]